MNIEFLPLLQRQRALLDQPRGMERFQAYLHAMVDTEGNLALPLCGFNPMSKSHVADLLDRISAMGAEEAAQSTLEEAKPLFQNEPGSYQLGLVVADDAKGGWTNRYFFEAKHHFDNPGELQRGFITVLLWTSDEPDLDRLRGEVRASIFRTAWVTVHGWPGTLREILVQEGKSARFGRMKPRLSASQVQQVGFILQPHLDTMHYPTLMACLYGDDAAESLGYEPLGLPHRAGLEWSISAAGIES